MVTNIKYIIMELQEGTAIPSCAGAKAQMNQ